MKQTGNKFNPPRSKSRIYLDFFARDAKTVARDLLGRILVVAHPRSATLYGRIKEIAAYEGDEDSMSGGTLYQPGTIAISTKHGQHLLDISTNKICVPSCVTIIGADVHDKSGLRELAQGPGNVTRALKIDREYNGVPLNFGGIWIGGEPVDPESISKRNKSDLPRNCKGYFYFK